MTLPDDVPPLVDQPDPPYGTWRAHRFGDDGLGNPPMGQMVWEPDERDRARGTLHDQVHDEGRWEMGPGETAIWRASDDGEE